MRYSCSSTPADEPPAGSRHFPPAAQMRPTPSDASRENRACVYTWQLRHLSCNSACAPCAASPKGTAASPAHSISASRDRHPLRTPGPHSTAPAISVQSPVDRIPSQSQSAPSQSITENLQSQLANPQTQTRITQPRISNLQFQISNPYLFPPFLFFALTFFPLTFFLCVLCALCVEIFFFRTIENPSTASGACFGSTPTNSQSARTFRRSSPGKSIGVSRINARPASPCKPDPSRG